MRRGAEEALARLDVHIDVARPVQGYSIALQQMVAIARSLSMSARVMILDEPVASLDPEGERAVFELFARLTDKIIIFTTNRYDSIPRDAQIVVLVDGRITEVGTHEQLLERQRDYWSLYVAGSSIAHGLLGSTRGPDGAGTMAARNGPTPRRPGEDGAASAGRTG